MMGQSRPTLRLASPNDQIGDPVACPAGQGRIAAAGKDGDCQFVAFEQGPKDHPGTVGRRGVANQRPAFSGKANYPRIQGSIVRGGNHQESAFEMLFPERILRPAYSAGLDTLGQLPRDGWRDDRHGCPGPRKCQGLAGAHAPTADDQATPTSKIESYWKEPQRIRAIIHHDANVTNGARARQNCPPCGA